MCRLLLPSTPLYPPARIYIAAVCLAAGFKSGCSQLPRPHSVALKAITLDYQNEYVEWPTNLLQLQPLELQQHQLQQQLQQQPPGNQLSSQNANASKKPGASFPICFPLPIRPLVRFLENLLCHACDLQHANALPNCLPRPSNRDNEPPSRQQPQPSQLPKLATLKMCLFLNTLFFEYNWA